MAAMAASVGRVIVQPDWHECLGETNAKFWVMFKRIDGKSVYADVRVTSCACGDNLSKLLCDSDDFEASHSTRDSLTVTYSSEEQNVRLVARFVRPESVFAKLHKPKKRIESIDVTSGGLGVSSDNDGNLLVWQTADGQLRRRLVGSVGDVYVAKFYPSGMVVLSGGADLRLRIWSVETGECAATLAGHLAAVNDCTFVDRGRNVLSVAKDGSLSLWDCGTQRQLARINCESGSLNACAIQHVDANASPSGEVVRVEHSELQCGTEQKLVAVACESNVCLLYELHSRRLACSWPSDVPVASGSQGAKSGAVTCCTFLNEQLLAFGCESSRLVVVRVHDSQQAVFAYDVPRSGVNAIVSLNTCIQTLRSLAFVAAFGDGSCVLFAASGQVSSADACSSLQPVLELTGPDCDALLGLACAQEDGHVLVFTACRDGVIRKYRVALSAIEQR